MRNGKTVLVLLRTTIFTAIVPYTVGLWLLNASPPCF